jgi:tetratricopeptide (TPR) repeat protein
VLLQASKQKGTFQVAYALGVVRAGARQTKKAVSSFKQASSLAKGNQQRFRAAIALATTYRTAGKLKQARKFCDQALGLNPAARFDSKYSSLVRFLRSSQKTKASSAEGPPPFIQLMLAEM